MAIELKSLNINESDEIYQIFQNLPKNEYGFENEAFDMTRDAFDLWCQKKVEEALGVNLDPGRVPQHHYIMYKDGTPIGLSKLRHNLNDFLQNVGGHIGYTVFKEHRNMGYGKILLTETLRKACNFGIEKALLICEEDNILSCKVILSAVARNGGEEIESSVYEGKVHRRFWISTQKDNA